MEKQGVFYAVSVGPGDPELLTRQACRVLEACDVIAAPRMKSGRMLALDIAAGAVDMQGKTVLPLDFTMARDAAVREDSYRTAAAAIKAELAAGRDVAMVNLGDVSVYATAYYMLERIRADGFETVMCPGVTSFCAVAARLGRSLTRMEEPLHILPGSAELDSALALPGTKVIMKSGHPRDGGGAGAPRYGGKRRDGGRLRAGDRAGLHRSAALAEGDQLFCHHRGGLRGRYGAKSPPAGAGRYQQRLRQDHRYLRRFAGAGNAGSAGRRGEMRSGLHRPHVPQPGHRREKL